MYYWAGEERKTELWILERKWKWKWKSFGKLKRKQYFSLERRLRKQSWKSLQEKNKTEAFENGIGKSLKSQKKKGEPKTE